MPPKKPKTKCSVDECNRASKAHGMCAMHNTRVWRLGTTELPPPRTKQQCIYEGCERWRDSHGYCSTHWLRIKKYGDPSVVKRAIYTRSGKPYLLNSGYLNLYEPEHPLAVKNGCVLVHRKVLFEAIGPGTHPCHHCGRPVTWGMKGADRLDVDHLDDDPLNNERSNLVPSCQRCNDGRPKLRNTHCSHGHEFTPETTYIDRNGHRRCRVCMRSADRKRRPPGVPR